MMVLLEIQPWTTQSSSSETLESLESQECTTASSDTGGMVLDLATVIELTPPEVTDEIKHAIIKNRLPGKDFKFPPKQYNDRSEASGVKQRYGLKCMTPCAIQCQQMESSAFVVPFFPYQPTVASEQMILSVFAVVTGRMPEQIFPNMSTSNTIEIQNQRWMHLFKWWLLRLLVFRTEYHRKWRNEYRAFLTCIIKCIELCGRQGIAFKRP